MKMADISATQSVVHGLEVSASLMSSLEMQNLGTHLRPTESESAL